jgi:hypothetical protein
MRPPVLSLVLFLLVGCAGSRHISGQVIDRNGEPMDRVVVSLSPGNVELVTDSEGRFTIDYLRDESGERKKLDKRTDYAIELFRPGYHISESSLYYKKGELILDPLTLTEDTIEIRQSSANIDPANNPDRTHSAGTNYEGE